MSIFQGKKADIIIGLIFLFITPFISSFLCKLFEKDVNFKGQLLDKKTMQPIRATISQRDGSKVSVPTKQDGSFLINLKTGVSRHPGCSCSRSSIELEVNKGGSLYAYSVQLDVDAASTDSTQTLFFFPPNTE